VSDGFLASFHAVLTDRGPAGGRAPIVAFLDAALAGRDAELPDGAPPVALGMGEDVRWLLGLCAEGAHVVGSLVERTDAEHRFVLAGSVQESGQAALYGMAALLAPWCADQHVATWVVDWGASLPTLVLVRDGLAHTWQPGQDGPAHAVVDGPPQVWPSSAWAGDVLGG
jgi:hypothetical protein